LTVSVQHAAHDEIESGHVIDQSTDPGQAVDAGSDITIIVSTGPDPQLHVGVESSNNRD